MLATALVDRLTSDGHRVAVTGSIDQVVLDGVEHDSRRIEPNQLFCAVRGAHFDGHDYAARAVAAGAVAVLVERRLDVGVPQLAVADVRRAMPIAAAAVAGDPSENVAVFGITGTNGKTTTTQMLASIFRSANRPVTVVGTLSGEHTTPESTDWQRLLRASVVAGDAVVAAEVSSHALDQHRVDATRFAVAAFANLTPDHLDYHGDMESYFEAKAQLFDGRADAELINVDDPWGRRLADRRPDATRVSLDAIEIAHADLSGSTFSWRGQTVRLPIAGRMNAANALMAAEAARCLGLADTEIVAGLSSMPQVRGRMEVVSDPSDRVTVVVDYSHTPDSIERALATLRDARTSWVTIVFGCGGDRDRAKRPLMGAAAEAGADMVVVTSDNPRSEEPMTIIDAALGGMRNPAGAHVEQDRREAIRHAIAHTPDGGVVLIAGKGHETSQTIGGVVHPFDDAEVSRALLREVREVQQ